MKKITFFLALVYCSYSCNSDKVNDHAGKAYTINGMIKGFNSEEVYLEIINKTDAKPDTIKVSNGKFSYTNNSELPEVAILVLPNREKMVEQKNVLMFFTDPASTIQITIDSSIKDKFVVTGSKINDDFKLFKQKYLLPSEEKEKRAFANIDMMSISNQRVNDSLLKLSEEIQQEKKDAVISYINENKSSIIGIAYAFLLGMQSEDSKFLTQAYTAVDSKIKNSFYGKEIKAKIDAVSKTEIGATAADFISKDADGKPIRLSEFYKGKKLVLIDFWASWCGPCRKENPNVVKAFNEFHTKGFEVLGVSLDEEKQEWIGAIKKDNLAWTQVSDLNGWGSATAKLYNVASIPSNFLIDGNGKILATNLRGDDLEKKLNALLK